MHCLIHHEGCHIVMSSTSQHEGVMAIFSPLGCTHTQVMLLIGREVSPVSLSMGDDVTFVSCEPEHGG